ncbi:hypothetical protein [Nannocystis radixulma]|uniref:Uncharacterized protein n=1 Tax=Nannocystis radixulma TaxID=2995305 RepID=A0ABT5B0W4_9BACT|nr:hypothetical protein [Nannocystis radixulma]MDC0667738.1 hypothetical protein [Nannocystis radixulma]
MIEDESGRAPDAGEEDVPRDMSWGSIVVFVVAQRLVGGILRVRRQGIV